MSSQSITSDNDNKPVETVVQQVLGAFYKNLSEKSEYKDVAERLKNETGQSEPLIRKALFGEGHND